MLAERLKQQVINDVLPNGIRKFPESFTNAQPKNSKFESIAIPKEKLKLGMFFLGEQEIITEYGFSFQAKNTAMAKYLIYSQQADVFTVKLPRDVTICELAVAEYESYVKVLEQKLFNTFFQRIFDHKMSEKLSKSVIEELGFPYLVEVASPV